MTGTASADLVAWHDAECGGYAADLPLWRELAGRGPVLDVGAGTGRVALDLAERGVTMTALDVEPVLLAELERRAAARGLEVATVVADATGFELPGAPRFAAILVPMQTVQLLPGAAARIGLLRSARRHLTPGGVVALALATELEPFDPADGPLPVPDVLDRDGRRYESQPVALRQLPEGARIERLRRVDGGRPTHDAIVLVGVSRGQLHAEGAAANLRPAPSRRIPATLDHVGSEVVILRG